MAKITAANNPVIIRRGAGIGSGNAESDDDFLFSCFVEYPAVDACRRMTSPVMVVAGRTGAGKTAILRYIENGAEHVSAIDPFEMSMSYVSNSDSLRFLQAIGADLDLLFQVLWKHVLCIEYIRLRWSVENTEKSKNIFARFVDQFSRDERKSKAIRYLKDWQGKFWITMDQNIKEITEVIEKKLHAEIGSELDKFKAGGQYDKRLSKEKKSEIVARTRKIISSEQLSELHGVIDMLSLADGTSMKSFYIMIDRLDEKWVDENVRFRMIRGLLESLRSFRKIPNLKILVALRADVLERVVQETEDISFQREKFEDFTARLIWSKTDLRRLVDKRLNVLFRRQYTGDTISFEHVFPTTMGSKPSFDWMLERTLMRPRDIIAFVNEAMDIADGQSSISVTHLRKAEIEFARKRKDALLQEWISAFPTIKSILEFFTSRKTQNVEIIELLDKVDDFCLQICTSNRQGFDPFYVSCQIYLEGKKRDAMDILQEAVAILYRVGAVGIKLTAQDRFIYSYIDQPIIAPNLILISSKARLHPMLQAAFNLQDR